MHMLIPLAALAVALVALVFQILTYRNDRH
jgi:hypothetical protein